MATTTKGIPTYFPGKRKDKKRKDKKMNEVELAIDLMEQEDLSPSDALELVLEGDVDKVAKKMAADATDDKGKQKELESKFKKRMKEMLHASDDGDDDDDDDEMESKRRKKGK